jgi:hypothetical protein
VQNDQEELIRNATANIATTVQRADRSENMRHKRRRTLCEILMSSSVNVPDGELQQQ